MRDDDNENRRSMINDMEGSVNDGEEGAVADAASAKLTS